jgi:diguanylate cyclase (GGDEF)-like protein
VRRFSLLALVGGLLLAGLALTLARSEHQRAVERIERHMRTEADIHAGRLATAFARVAAAVQLTARQPSLMAFDEAPGPTEAKLRAGGRELQDIRVVLDNLARSDPSGLGQVLHADRRGVVTAVVSGGAVLAPRALEQVERATVLRPVMDLTVGQVLHSRPYRSPAGGQWVVSATTVTASEDNVKRSFVHAEVLLEGLRLAAATGPDHPYEVVVVDRRNGDVVLDGAQPQQPGAVLGAPSDRRFLRLRLVRGGRGLVRLDGHPAAWQVVTEDAANVNDWVLVARSRRAVPTLVQAAGPLPLGAGVVALLLVLAGLAGLRSQHAELEEAAGSDALTGLPNRRALAANLARRTARDASPSVLLLYDLDGFKTYNDTFGHLAGDALLQRLGRELATVAAVHGGTAYRLGGDEFCVLASAGSREELEAQAALALTAEGDGFTVGASCGAVALPTEAHSPDEALRLADDRMYASKAGGRLGADLQSKDVLLRALAERDPDLSDHLGGVADLAEAVARRLGLDEAGVRSTRHAAELHDIGKVAIPDSILHKPGPLDDGEWAFMRRHTIIGERIIAAAPALEEVARIVRSSHERWDGGGYPDGLAGEAIPIASRIVAVCDAYDAITADRPYAEARTSEQALGELARCAHHQFDPDVVAAFAAELGERLMRASAVGP